MRFKARNTVVLAAGGAVVALATAVAWPPQEQQAQATEITVYKSPSCGCCGNWIDHLRDNGFSVATRNVKDLSPIRSKHGVTPELAACHTAIVDGYVVEGHVPAQVIQRLLAERPSIVGIAVPGMPPGSPGMEVGYTQPYDVLTFDEDGNTEVYEQR
ncbi:MAG: DUF411 domain-containing protein [Gammaproteobacteria bacterium]